MYVCMYACMYVCMYVYYIYIYVSYLNWGLGEAFALTKLANPKEEYVS